MNVKGHEVKGIQMDSVTRCMHYHSVVDIIAIKFKCCDTYYPCYECHESIANHKVKRWGKDEHDEKAILCGQCGSELTIDQYLHCHSTCPNCKAPFNPGCSLHYDIYFE